MPLGFERLNERSQRPNALINFIKPLEGADKAIAEDYLNRIAAQCYPVMKAAHISVMSLEEFPANKEFLGRNFNAGECIQLVLKDNSGNWLGFKFVQMVMMHELAHCKEMNHSRYFWQVRNQYAQEMQDLWLKKYHGEGVWGRGQDLNSGRFVFDHALTNGDVPEHLCGGSYRRRGRKRKRAGNDTRDDDAKQPSYAERQQRRIAKKFGKHGEGNALGENELVRGALEQGHRHQGKPRVAGSKRGRELRAQAALARFEASKTKQKSEFDENDSETDWSESELGDDHRDIDPERFVNVCADEDAKDEHAGSEMNELRMISSGKVKSQTEVNPSLRRKTEPETRQEDSQSTDMVKVQTDENRDEASTKIQTAGGSHHSDRSHTTVHISDDDNVVEQTTVNVNGIVDKPQAGHCPICSLENDNSALLCIACSHVLRPKLVKNSWRCSSQTCSGSAYLNAGNAGRCGICGNAKPVVPVMPPKGPISADVLRWD